MAGLNWDEGPVVGGAKNEYFQSMRLELYNQHFQELLEKGLAYEAYESRPQIEALKKAGESGEEAVSLSAGHAGAAVDGTGGGEAGGAVCDAV